jgi:Cu-processing system permease protein
MERSLISAIAVKEARAGLRNRWFVLYAVMFSAVSIGFSLLALGGSNLTGQPGFGRTSAGLLNLMLLIAPLMGLTIGAQSIATDREDRSLDYLLAQPVSSAEVFLGKYLGAAISLSLLMLKGTTAEFGDYLTLIVFTICLGLGMLSAGYMVSSWASSPATALGIALTLWLVLILAGDLGLMGGSIAMELRPGTLLTLTLLNPLDVYKILSVDRLQPSLDVLGPAGTYATRELGRALAPTLVAILVLWVVAPLPVGFALFKRSTIR